MSKEEYHINLSLQRVLLTGYSSCYIVFILYHVPDSGSLLRKTFQEICLYLIRKNLLFFILYLVLCLLFEISRLWQLVLL